MQNFKLVLSYDGTDFNGWQTQPGYRTVQETLEQAIAAVTGEPRPHVNASGRTDAGVHAVGQVVNFYSEPRIMRPRSWSGRSTPICRADVVVREADRACRSRSTPTSDAVRKLYRYVIHDGPCPTRSCGVTLLQSTAPRRRGDGAGPPQRLVGRHDFHSFETEWPNRLSSVRTITHLAVNRFGD